MEILSGIIGALVGGIATLVIGRLETKRRERLATTRLLYDRWNSDEMIVARLRAYPAIIANVQRSRPLTFTGLTREMINTPKEQDLLAIKRVLRFFEYCGALTQAGAIDMQLMRSLLGAYATYWIDGYFEPLWRISVDVDEVGELDWHPRLVGLVSAMRERAT